MKPAKRKEKSVVSKKTDGQRKHRCLLSKAVARGWKIFDKQRVRSSEKDKRGKVGGDSPKPFKEDLDLWRFDETPKKEIIKENERPGGGKKGTGKRTIVFGKPCAKQCRGEVLSLTQYGRKKKNSGTSHLKGG